MQTTVLAWLRLHTGAVFQDPICPLFEELYLTQGLGAESTYQWDHEKGAPGGPNYMTLNGCARSPLRIPLAGADTWGADAYQRFDFRAISERLEDDKDADGTVAAPTDEEIEAAEREPTHDPLGRIGHSQI